jgi:hypothetical protein
MRRSAHSRVLVSEFRCSFVFRRFARYSAPWGRTSLTASRPMVNSLCALIDTATIAF